MASCSSLIKNRIKLGNKWPLPHAVVWGFFYTHTCLLGQEESWCGSQQWWWRWSKARWSESATTAVKKSRNQLCSQVWDILTVMVKNQSLTGCLMVVNQFFQRRRRSCWKKAISREGCNDQKKKKTHKGQHDRVIGSSGGEANDWWLVGATKS